MFLILNHTELPTDSFQEALKNSQVNTVSGSRMIPSGLGLDEIHSAVAADCFEVSFGVDSLHMGISLNRGTPLIPRIERIPPKRVPLFSETPHISLV